MHVFINQYVRHSVRPQALRWAGQPFICLHPHSHVYIVSCIPAHLPNVLLFLFLSIYLSIDFRPISGIAAHIQVIFGVINSQTYIQFIYMKINHVL